MRKSHGRITLVILGLGLFNTLNISQSAQGLSQSTGSVGFEEVLWWLPADTETISVARGLFALPSTRPKLDEDENRVVTDQELVESFETLPLSLVGFKDGLLLPRLKGKRVLLAIEGARHFRPPSGLGELPYEGCAIALFADDVDHDMDSFVRANRNSVLTTERIGGQAIAVFQEKLENDTWTFFVAFPSKRTLVVATSRDYLSEVLARLQGKKGDRALPNDLAEWKYVNTELRFWGLRHFDKRQAKLDPSSPFGGRKAANTPDEQAIGLTFGFDQSKARQVSITYLSGDQSVGMKPDASLLSLGRFPEARGLNIKYRELVPGIVEGSYTFKNRGQLQFFLFVFEGMLGHAVFI